MVIGILLQCLPITSAQAATITTNNLIQPVAVAPSINTKLAFLPPVNTPYSGVVSVTTRGYNTARTGANLNETVLSTTNVSSATFGKLFQRAVDGDIYAQPLYMSNVNITYTRNVVYVATEHNSVYAFDADDPNASAPLWQVNLGTSAKNNFADYGLRYGTPYHDIQKEVGVTSTPVIDPGTGTMYVVNFECVLQSDPTTQCDPTNMITDTNQIAAHTYRHFIHALDIRTGAEKYGGPAMITGQVQGSGGGSVGGFINFDSKQQLQRPGLTLVNGNLYIAFSGFADTNPYHGWVMVYNPFSLTTQTGIWNTTPNAGSSNTNDPEGEGGIWESGQGLTADSGGNLYVMTGNGTFDLNTNNNPDAKQKQYADSFVKLDTRHSDVVPIDWFTPNCQSWMKTVDADLGSGGPIAIPGPNPDPQGVGDLIIGTGKQGNIYVLKESGLGGYTPPGSPTNSGADCLDTGELSNIADRIDNGVGGGAYAAPVYWNSPTGKRIYYWGTSDKLKAFQMFSSTGITFTKTPVATGSTTLSGGMPGGMLALSANGSTSGTGIIWAMHVLTTSQSANATTRSGILRAYNAETLAQLWTSEMVPARDSLNNGGGPNTSFLSKFNMLTVANGKVYVPTFAPGGGTTAGTYSTNLGGPAYLMVYGLLASQVTKPNDDGAINSLSYALTHSPPNQIISLSPSSGTVINVTAALPNVPTGLTLKGTCAAGPGITIKYTGATPNVNGLTLTSNVWLYGIKMQAFTGVQIKIPSGGDNVTRCVQASKT
jgi:hypothetical protein